MSSAKRKTLEVEDDAGRSFTNIKNNTGKEGLGNGIVLKYSIN